MSHKILGPATGYVDLLNEATTAKLEKEMKDGSGFNKTPIRPSAAGACTRELYYQLMEFHGQAKYEKELKTPEVQRLLNLGHSIEWHVIKEFQVLKEFELKYKQQVLSFKYLEVKDAPKMSQWLEGSLDLVLWSDKYKCVADVKSKKDGWYRPYKSKWDELSEKLNKMTTVKAISAGAFWVDDLGPFLKELDDPFFASNFLQLNLYANSSFLKERGVDHGAILQYCKNDSRLREIRFRPCEGVYNQTIGKFETALKAAALQNPELAPRDYPSKETFKCRYCPFKKECWKGVKTIKK